MPVENYGVWVCKPVRVTAERATEDSESPHIHLFYKNQESDSEEFRASINVKSLSELSELVFWENNNFQHPIVNKLSDLEPGFQEVPSEVGGVALDYIRGNLMSLDEGQILPHDLPEERDDIIDYVMPVLQSAIDRNTNVYLFGEPYSNQRGIHNIHMNQGSAGRFTSSNGVYQDGGIIIHFLNEDRYAAIFLAFASQAVHTDDLGGNALPESKNFKELLDGREDTPITDNLPVAIIAALVNPVGSENQGDSNVKPEVVYLLNRSTQDISLKDWSLVNINGESYRITDDAVLASGEIRIVTMTQVPLSNQGGLISLLDEKGNKVDGVTYTRKQAQKSGELVIFR